MKKILLELDLEDDEKAKRKALKTVCTLSGINFISMDMKGKKMTVIGTVDPIKVVSKLRKYWEDAFIISAGPLPEPEKKEEAKKEEKKEEPKKEEKKDEPKKEEPKKEEPKKEEKKEEEKKEEEKKVDPLLDMVKLYRPYYPHMSTYYHAPSMEENPNACVIL